MGQIKQKQTQKVKHKLMRNLSRNILH